MEYGAARTDARRPTVKLGDPGVGKESEAVPALVGKARVGGGERDVWRGGRCNGPGKIDVVVGLSVTFVFGTKVFGD